VIDIPRRYEPPPSGMLPEHGKRILAHAYTSARERGYTKERSAKQAWGAVEKVYARADHHWARK